MRGRSIVKQWPLHLLLAPGVVLVLLFSYGPMVGVTIAFKDFNLADGIWRSSWNGWDNFRFLFEMTDIAQVVRNTVTIAVMKMAAGMIAPLITALLLNEVRNMAIKRGIQTVIYLPHFLSWIILGGILIDILSPSEGIVNQLLGLFGIKPIFFLGSPDWFPFVAVLSDVWKEFGFSTIIYLAALTGINPALYEAAVVDGASRWRQSWHITLPGISPIIILLATLSVGNVLNAGFEQIFVLYSPLVYETGDIIDTFTYRLGLIDYQYGPAAAVGLFKSAVSLIFISVSYYLAYRLANYRIF
ncbi:ABC transporter permease [Paenibacillus sp. GCM10027626]|uniref:ABC transporter permease n=1 Tax=Paenibacillus sp. GCM10027626 TaxID=3273411 RepID=UPI003636E257